MYMPYSLMVARLVFQSASNASGLQPFVLEKTRSAGPLLRIPAKHRVKEIQEHVDVARALESIPQRLERQRAVFPVA